VAGLSQTCWGSLQCSPRTFTRGNFAAGKGRTGKKEGGIEGRIKERERGEGKGDLTRFFEEGLWATEVCNGSD